MNFSTLGNLPVSKAAQELKSSRLWDAFTARQEFQKSPHKQTKCIPLRGAKDFMESYNPKAKRGLTKWAYYHPHTVALVNRVLRGMPVKTVGNVLAVALEPGGWILPHIDLGDYPDHFERFHIVVTSPEGNWFRVRDEFFFPEEGDIFLFNHRTTHSAGNPNQDAPRIHLIVDATLKE